MNLFSNTLRAVQERRTRQPRRHVSVGQGRQGRGRHQLQSGVWGGRDGVGAAHQHIPQGRSGISRRLVVANNASQGGCFL